MDKARRWFKWEVKDLDKRIRSYPKFRLLLFLATIGAFGLSLFWLWGQTNPLVITRLDSIAADFVARNRHPVLDFLFRLLTTLGDENWIILSILLVGAYLLYRRRKRAAAVTWLVLFISGLVNTFLRNFIFGRLRPSGCIETYFRIDSCFAFPSGHALWSTYFYGLLLYLIFRFVPISFNKYALLSIGVAFLVVFIGLSRIYLGVHYLSDVVGGYIHGAAWLLLAILLIDILYHDVK
jgi:membrane-associated phospholipid phosphatase